MSNHWASLPDELVKEALTPLLRVPDDLFGDTSRVSPFAVPSESSSTMLVVCKQWMRVATPLLYHVAVLRSKAQAQALERTLKENPELGRHIRKLRLEGGFGIHMHKIIVGSPNITHLCLTMDLWSFDNISGLKRSMLTVQPEHIVIRGCDEYQMKLNKLTNMFVEKLCECIKVWDKLKTFDFTFFAHYTGGLGGQIAAALAESPSLDTLIVPYKFSTEILEIVARNKSLRRVRVKPPPPDLLSELYPDPYVAYARGPERVSSWHQNYGNDKLRKVVATHERLRSLVEYDDSALAPSCIPLPLSLTPTNPTYIPMVGAPKDVKEIIWSRIIYFATTNENRLPRRPELRWYWTRRLMIGADGKATPIAQVRLSIARTCKLFWRLTKAHLYADIELASGDAIMPFAKLLVSKPELSKHIKTLYFRALLPHAEANDSYHTKTEENLSRSLNLMLSVPLTGLVSVKQGRSQDCCPWDVVRLLCPPGENRIKVLHLNCIQPTSSAAFSDLHRLSRLVHLEIRLKYSGEQVIDPELMAMPCALPELQVLVYEEVFSWMPPKFSLLDALATFELPSLHTVTLSSSMKIGSNFLKAHGSKIREAKIDHLKEPFLSYCHNLRSLAIQPGNRPYTADVGVFAGEAKHHSLEIIQFGQNMVWKDIDVTWWDSLNLDVYTSLKEIRMEDCSWPKTERDILKGKNPWVAWSELLKKEYNIKLTDEDGNHWIPRLTTEDVKSSRK